MKDQKYSPDYERAKKILESCQTMAQINVAIRYFNQFINKWKRSISEYDISWLMNEFNIEISLKLSELNPGEDKE
jgi:hypothetical protein